MALSAKAGSFTGSGSTGNQAVTGVGFQPVVVVFWWNFLSSDTNAADFVLGMGVGISSTARRAAGNYSTDALTTSSNAAWNQSSTCIYSPGGSPRADFVSQDSDGFTINWISSNATVINYLALGGADLTNVKTGAIAAKTTTGNQAYTGIGFQPTALILFAGKFSTDPLDQSTNGASMIGFATSSTARGCISWRNKNGANPQIAKHRQSKSKCAISVTDTGIFTEADFVSFDSDGFTLNFTTAGGTADVIYYLALRGPQFKVSSLAQPASTGNQALTGAGFTPKASLMLSNNDIAANDDTTANHALVSLGIATSATARGSLWAGETHNVSPTQADRMLDRTKLIKLATQNTVATTAAADHVSFDSDGQTINWTTADATAREILVLWMGSAPANVTVTPSTATLTTAKFAPQLKLAIQPATASLTTARFAPTLARRALPATQSLALTTFAPRLRLALVPATRSLAIATFAPTLRRAAIPVTANLSLATFAPSLKANLTPATRTLTLTGFGPTLARAVIPGTLSLSTSAFAPVAAQVVRLTLPAASVSISAFAPLLVEKLSPATATLTITSFAPTVIATANKIAAPATVSLSLLTFTATLALKVRPATSSLATSGFAPTLVNPVAVIPSVATLTVQAFAPGLSLTLTPSARSLTVTGFAPALGRGVVPTTRSLVTTGFAPSLRLVITPATDALTLSSTAPTISVTDQSTIIPAAGSLALTVFPPTVLASISAIPVTRSLTLSTFAPRLNVKVTPTAISLTITGQTPSLTTRTNITPSTCSLTLAGFAPRATLHVRTFPLVASLAITPFAPSLRAAIVPVTAALALSPTGPTVLVTVSSIPATASLTLIAHAPALSGAVVILTPDTIDLALTSYAPRSLTFFTRGFIHIGRENRATLVSREGRRERISFEDHAQ